MDEPNPIKDILYDYLQKFDNEKTARQIASGDAPALIHDITAECFPKIKNLSGNPNENIGIFATSLLHYLLTEALIPSQRKVEYKGSTLDIIIPDLRTLSNDPKNCLLLVIINSKTDLKRVEELSNIQPNLENIWIIATHKIENEFETFVIGETSFSNILEKIKWFLDSTNKRHFKIFKQ